MPHIRKAKRWSLVHATEATDCGPAALATVLRHYGSRIGVRSVRQSVAPGAQGCSIEALRIAAEQLGFEATVGRTSQHGLRQIPLPAVAHLDGPRSGHFVVVHAVASDAVLIADPVRGLDWMSVQRFCDGWTGHVLLLRPTTAYDANAGEPDPSPAWVLLSLVLHNWRLVLLASVCAALLTSAGLGTALVSKFLLETALGGYASYPTALLTFALLGLAIGRGVVTMVRALVVSRLGYAVESRTGRRLLAHILMLDLPSYERRPPGDLFARVFDIGMVRNAVSTVLVTSILDAATLSIACVVLVSVDGVLAAVTLSAIPLACILSGAVLPRLRRHDRDVRARFSAFAAESMELLSGIRAIKAFGREASFLSRWQNQYDDLLMGRRLRDELNGVLAGLSVVVASLPVAAVLLLGTARVLDGRLGAGDFFMFMVMMGFVGSSAAQIQAGTQAWQEALLSVTRVQDIEMEQHLTEPQNRSVASPVIKGDFDLQDVTFAYPHRPATLHGITLTIAGGQTTAIVGATGAGKSTLALLLSGLYAPVQGAVRIDGHKPASHSMTRRGGVVLLTQDPCIISGTIEDNVAFGAPSMSRQHIDECLRLAEAGTIVSRSPDGLRTQVGARGGALSAGERQRIAIARAVAMNPSVMILDEATSNLDVETEARVIDNIQAHHPALTLILVTHRPHLAARANRVIVLNGGRMVAIGDHNSLLATDDAYRRLWAADRSGASTVSNASGPSDVVMLG